MVITNEVDIDQKELNKLIRDGKIIDISDVPEGEWVRIDDKFFNNELEGIEFHLVIEYFILELIEIGDGDIDDEESVIDEFIENFKSDLLMNILYDTVENLINLFNSKKKINQYQEIFNNIFFGNKKDYIDYLDRFIKYNPANKDKIEVLKVFYEDFYNKIPRVLMPWYLYAFKIESENLSNGKSIINPIRKKKLHLFEIRNKSAEFIENAIEEIKGFFNILAFDNGYINKSLNIFAFNHVTNLLDVYILSRSFFIDFKLNEFFKTDQLKEGAYYYEKNVGILNMSGVESKDFALRKSIFNENYFRESKDILWYNQLKGAIKNSILKFFNDDIILSEDIEKEYFIYNKLMKLELYENILSNEDIFKFFEEDKIIEQLTIAYRELYIEKKKKKDLSKNQEQLEQVEQVKKNTRNDMQPRRKTIIDLLKQRELIEHEENS